MNNSMWGVITKIVHNVAESTFAPVKTPGMLAYDQVSNHSKEFLKELDNLLKNGCEPHIAKNVRINGRGP